MIEPNMATMLAFLLTDAGRVAGVPARGAARGRRPAASIRLTVDGEGSTSDTALLLASGCAATRSLRSARSPRCAPLHRRGSRRPPPRSRASSRATDGAPPSSCTRDRGSARARTADAPSAPRGGSPNSLLVKTALSAARCELGSDPADESRAGRIALRLARTTGPARRVVVFRNGASAGPRPRAARAQRSPAKN
jgi:N-acetylglutamate synthase/N-acetylornithine aminotransferase